MNKKMMRFTLCAAFVVTALPALAAAKDMPQGKRDEMSMKDTKKQIKAQKKENAEANKNVDKMIDNRK